MPLRPLPLVGVLALALLLPAAAPARDARISATDGSWTSYGHDDLLTNSTASSSIDSDTAPRLRLVWKAPLDGAVVASPLGALVGERRLVYVTTEAGSVYALDAGSGAVVWQRTFPTVTTPDDACGTYGFSSTGVVDTGRGVLYEIGADGYLHALDLRTGDEADGWPLKLIGRTSYTYVWGGLRLVGDMLYVPVASYCDQLDETGLAAEGRLEAVDVTLPAVVSSWDPVPGYGNLGGLWGWGGVAIDPSTGNLYTGVGNSWATSTTCGCRVDDAGYGDSLVELSPDLGTVVSSDRPAGVPPTGDDDFGAAPVLFEPPGCPPLAAANNKVGTLFVWNRTDLGAGPLASIPLSDAKFAFVGAPSWSPLVHMLYDAEVTLERGGQRRGSGVIALRPEAGCTFVPVWSAVTGDGDQPPPLVVDDVVFADGGAPGGFEALRAETGAVLWRFATPGAETIAPAAEIAGTIFAGDTNGTVCAFRPPAARRRVRRG